MSTTALAPALAPRPTLALELPRQRSARPCAARAARPARPARGRRRPLRLTRRGRLLLTCTAASALAGAVIVATGALSGASAGAGVGPGRAPAPAVHTVLPGQTLSTIAEEWAPSQDWREVADEIVALNALPSMSLQVGQRLTLPDRD